jgi:hypothetical protein
MTETRLDRRQVMSRYLCGIQLGPGADHSRLEKSFCVLLECSLLVACLNALRVKDTCSLACELFLPEIQDRS